MIPLVDKRVAVAGKTVWSF